MSISARAGDEIVPGFTLVRLLGSGMAGEVWVARASGGVQVAIKIIQDLELLGSQRELGALRIVREVKHPNLCPLFGVWFFDVGGNLFNAAETEAAFYHDPKLRETMVLDSTNQSETEADDQSFVATQPMGTSAPIPHPSPESARSDERPDHPIPTQMVVAMGLGEKTLIDRLHEVQSSKQKANQLAGIETDESKQDGIEVHELLRYINAAASAIDELNKRYSIYHCDIKPQNILVVGGQAQVCDFGLARQVAKSRQTQMAFGTPAYGAPEMLFDRTYSKTIDQYSLAITYYELRTGKLPFDRVTQSSLLKAKASGKLDLALVAPEERDVISKATRLDPTKRYEDCQSFVAALKSAVDRPPAAPRQWRAPVTLAALLIAVGSAIAAWWFLFADMQPTPQPETTTTETASVEPEPEPEVAESDSDSASEVAESEPKEAPQKEEIVETRPIEPDTIIESEAESVTEHNIEPMEPEATESESREMAVPSPDLNAILRSTAASIDSTTQRIVSQFRLLQNADPEAINGLDPKILEALVAEACGVMQAQFHAVTNQSESDRELIDHANEMVTLLIALLPKAPLTNTQPLLAQLALAQLQREMAVSDSVSPDMIAARVAQVRRHFDANGHYAYPEANAEAALAIAYSWPAQWNNAAWDFQLAESDLQRSESLNPKDSANQNAVISLHGRYLIALLLQRSRLPLDKPLADATERAATSVISDSKWSTIASMALWLLHPIEEKDETSLPANKRPSLPKDPPSTLPVALEPQYRLAAGWADWHQGESRSAFDAWQKAAMDADLTTKTADQDRHRAAQYLLNWLIKSSDTSDNQIDSIRYSRLHRSAIMVLDAVEKLGAGADALQLPLASERLLCCVAAADFDTAKVLLTQYRRLANERLETDLTPQLGRAVFDIASNHVDSNRDSPDAEWTYLLCAGCIAQTTDDLFQEHEASKRSREALFVRCYRPVMQEQKPRMRSSALETPRIPNHVDERIFAKFCDNFVKLAAQPDGRRIYQDILQWLDDVEVAGAIAGNASSDFPHRADLLCTASEAFMQSRYEQQDDIAAKEIIRILQQYHREAVTIGNTPRADFLLARIADQKGFAEADSHRSTTYYQDAIRLYDQLIDSTKDIDDGFRGVVLRCRASIQQRRATQLNAPQSERVHLKALEDARDAIGLHPYWHADNDDRLETLADVCWGIVSASTSVTKDEKNSLLNEAIGAIDQAILMRRRDSLEFTQLALKKLNGLWIDMLVNGKSVRTEQTKNSALQWMNEISDQAVATEKGRLATLTIRADSARLRSQWHSRAARVYDIIGDKKTARQHSDQGYAIATKSLDAEDPLRHIISLEYVILKSEALGSGSRQFNRELVQQLKSALNQIQNPRPDIRAKKDFFLKELAKY
ncbi:Serine/threonine-protein kinase pkn6 [Planctomycetes bacterium CA13]|uniref:Serine/threonine-protein kinase pkn6 n=1 Tax=Novipirellula herctigrandis TaxID=2527986 RepID=A0A5C5Z4Q3_9BACT|nr:Serine/threonine-protein kinase pkn6 [Planctomycetes bacterium CA13]